MAAAVKSMGIIGGGNMGAAILARAREAYDIAVCEQNPERAAQLKRRYRVKILPLTDLLAQSRIILLAVKPQDIDGVLAQMRPALTPRHLIISIAAGVTTRFLEDRLPGTRVIRSMPNMPAQAGAGVTAVCAGSLAKPADLKAACAVFQHVGTTVVVEESLMDAVTAVSGSGPAYVFYFVECFLAAAREAGLSEALSAALVRQTLHGSLRLLEESEEDAASLRTKVTSKGGTTQAALEVFAQAGWPKIFTEAVAAARRRAGELSQR